MKIPLLTPAIKGRSVNITAQERTNVYPELNGVDKMGMPNYSLIGTPGKILFGTMGDNPTRGAIRTTNGTLLAVAGNNVYTVTTGGTGTSIGTIGTTSGIVRLADNGTEIMITDGNRAYYTDLSTVSELTDLTTIISDNGYDGPVWCTAQDGYMITHFPNSENFYISAVDDASSWSSLDFASADGRPGYIRAIISHRNELWILKELSYEPWYNSGNASFPFELHRGSEGEIGCLSPQSVGRLGNTLMWLGANEEGQGIAYSVEGYTPLPITNTDMSYIFNTFSDVTDCEAYTYQTEGHRFYVMSFPRGDQTWVYDLDEKLWHRRGYLNPNTNAFERDRGHVQVHFNQKDYVGDYETGEFFELDLDTYADNGNPIQRTFVPPHVRAGQKRLFVAEFGLNMEAGVGLSSGQGSDPQAMFSFSKDRGHTWSNERWTSMGKQGKYNARINWHRCGSALDTWTPKVVISEPVKVVIHGAYVE